MIIEDENGNEVEAEKPVVEQPKEKGEFDGLSNREAIEKAAAVVADREPAPKTPETPTKTEVKQAVDSDLEPPAGLTKLELEAWKAKDVPAIQKAFRRIHDDKTKEMTRAQTSERQAREEANREKQEATTWREFGKMAGPYIEAQGLKGVTPQQAMMNALSLISAFKNADPATAKAELKALGIDLDKAPESKTNQDPDLVAKIDALQKWKTDTESQIERQKFTGLVQTYESAYKNLDSLTTRTGDKVFPDLLDEAFCSTNEGKLFHSELGSLTKDPIFVKGVFRRFPEADFTIVCREAYLALGGKVAGAPVKVSPSNQQHIDKSRRAAASTPGRVVSRSDSSALVNKLSGRAALEKAYRDSQEH